MTLKVKGVKIVIRATHHANHWVGATFTWPNGKKTYGEYKTVGEAIETVLNDTSHKQENNHDQLR